MIYFHRYDLQVRPGASSLTLYAPDWEALKAHEDCMRLAEENRPCHIQAADTQYWYHDDGETRPATQEEIERWTADGEFLSNDRLEILPPVYYYMAFGDGAVIDTLKEKLAADYAEYLDEWRAASGEGSEKMAEVLAEICTVKTVYDNLNQCCDGYPTEYMRELADEEAPLRILSFFYDRSGWFDIVPEASHELAILEKNQVGYDSGMLDERAVKAGSHEERMAILDENLDREFLGYRQKWERLDFEGMLDKAVEIHTVSQLYHSLRQDKHLYRPEQLDMMARLSTPMEHGLEWMVVERELCAISIDEIRSILPQMYPDVQVIPDPWETWGHTDRPEPAEERKAEVFLKNGFTIPPEKEVDYQQLQENDFEDFYGAGILRYAKRWGNMMEQELAGGLSVAEAAEKTMTAADTEGITGYMYGNAVGVLSEYWSHGEELRQWHNQRYQYTGDDVVNPAILDSSNGEETPEETEQNEITMQ